MIHHTSRRLGPWSAATLTFGALPAAAQVELDFWTEFSAEPERPVLGEIVAGVNAANPGIVPPIRASRTPPTRRRRGPASRAASRPTSWS